MRISRWPLLHKRSSCRQDGSRGNFCRATDLPAGKSSRMLIELLRGKPRALRVPKGFAWSCRQPKGKWIKFIEGCRRPGALPRPLRGRSVPVPSRSGGCPGYLLPFPRSEVHGLPVRTCPTKVRPCNIRPMECQCIGFSRPAIFGNIWAASATCGSVRTSISWPVSRPRVSVIRSILIFSFR